MEGLNKNEQLVFDLLGKWGYEECDAYDRQETTMMISKESGMSRREVAGYLSSLVKKDLAETFQMEANGHDKFICVK